MVRPAIQTDVVVRVLARCIRDGECIVWQGAKSNGYGHLSVNGKNVQTHRAVYEARHGAIPDGLEIDHVRARGCRSRACCNIDHLEAVTSRVNTLRGDTFQAANAAKTHCKRGHLLSGDNLQPYALARGMRSCVICVRTRTSVNSRARHGHKPWRPGGPGRKPIDIERVTA